MNIKVPFGLRENQVIHISELDIKQKGLACNCECVQCGKKLIARLGNHNINHFAHENKCECPGGLETALHIFAKEILSKRKEIVVPNLSLEYCDFSTSKKYIDVVSGGKRNTNSRLLDLIEDAYYEKDYKCRVRKKIYVRMARFCLIK